MSHIWLVVVCEGPHVHRRCGCWDRRSSVIE